MNKELLKNSYHDKKHKWYKKSNKEIRLKRKETTKDIIYIGGT